MAPCCVEISNIALTRSFNNSSTSRHVALDCDYGIGRVAKNLLYRHFHEVDLVEPTPHFLDAARESLTGGGAPGADECRAVNVFCVPL
ncbi:alpha N-terminal protein methyltransferase 1 [Iris pallida]|uniref:Alpha N-terminal protein methyltransferase 1 n=1 Tax=Iris pallida TaxID=29817 RepID=A0AAX6FNZ8_IRIPA|nr:alpha N-terminal protein methyltransferase 1 [Iris pallida]KAJ6830321.1 alpha N-terminal protein methyltransferase 1 [Iris pallida]